MNWLKLMTKNGRKDIARGLLKDALTPETVVEWSTKAANETVMKALRDVDDAKIRRVVGYCYDGADLCKAIAAAIEDKVITSEEGADIYQKLASILDGTVTQERVDALIEKVVAKVP